MKRFWILTTLGFLLVALLAAVAQFSGLAAIESYRGVYAPVWSPNGETIYYVERRTTGVVLGPGWEFFTPPAETYLLADALEIHRLAPETGVSETLMRWSTTPLVGHWIGRYRGRIFGVLQAKLETDAEGLDYGFALSIPRQPHSDTHGLRGRWPAEAGPADWQSPAPAQMFGYAEHRLLDGIELITVPGPESYPSAILAIDAEGSRRTMLATDGFRARYPDGVPAHIIDAQSRREPIERHRDFRRTYAARVAHHKARGVPDATARLRAYDDLEDLGYLPKDPQLVATRLTGRPADSPVFAITEREFHVGLFPDIEQAIRAPGQPVEKAFTNYIHHDAFDTSARLNAWLERHDSFVVEHDGIYYRLEIRRHGRPSDRR